MFMTQHEVLSKSGDGVSYLTGSLSGHGAGTGHAPALLDSSSLWGCRRRMTSKTLRFFFVNTKSERS